MAGTSKLKQVGKVLGGTGLVGGAGLGGYAYGGAKGLEQGRREGFEAGYRRAKKEDRSAAMALSQGAQMRSQRRQMKRPEPAPQKQNQSTNSPEPAEQNTDEPETNMKSASVLKRAVSGTRGEMSNDMQGESHLEVRKHDGGYVIVNPETGEIKSDKPYASRSKAEKTKESMSGNTKTGEKGENLDRNEYFQNEAKGVLSRQNQLRRRKRKEQRKDNTATGGISGTAIGAAAAPMIGEIAPRRFENAASLASPIVTGLAGAGIGRSLSKNVPGEVDVENMETSMSDEPANPGAAKRMKNREGVGRKTVNIDYGNNQQKNKKYDFYHNKPGDSSNTMNQGSPDKEAKNSEGASYKQDTDMENDCGCDKTASTKEADEDPCWEGYEQIGMKTKDGKKVPNCVPKDDEKSARILASATQSKNIKEASTKEADEDPCWEGYEQYGMKEKDGKQVPNCVPKDNEKSARILSHAANSNSEKTAGGTRMMQGQQQQMRQGQRQMSQGQRQMSQEQAKRMLMQEVQRRRQQMRRARQEAAQKGEGNRQMQNEQQNQSPQSAQAMQPQTSESRQSKKKEQEVDKTANESLQPNYEAARYALQKELDRRAGKDPASRMTAMDDALRKVRKDIGDRRRKQLNRHREGDTETTSERASRFIPNAVGLTGLGALGGGMVGGVPGAVVGGAGLGGGYSAYEALRGPRKIRHPDETGLSETAMAAQTLAEKARQQEGLRKEIAYKPQKRERKRRQRRKERRERRKAQGIEEAASSLKNMSKGEKQAMKKEAEYKIVEENGGFYVVNKETGEKKNEDPHDTKEDAREHQKALYANVKDASMKAKIASAYHEGRIDESERDYLLSLKESIDKSGVDKEAEGEAPPVSEAPSYEEAVPKDNFRQGGANVGMLAATPTAGMLGAGAYDVARDATPAKRIAAPVLVGGAALGAGAAAGRYGLASDESYEEGRKDYNKRIKNDPEYRRKIVENKKQMEQEKSADVNKEAKPITQTLADNSDTITAAGAGLMAAGSLAPPIQRAANSALDPIRRRIRYNRMEAERPDTGQPASARINRDVLEREYGIPQEGLSDEEAERRARKKVFRIVHDNAPEVTRMPSVARKVVDQQIKGGNPAAAMQQANNMASDAVSNMKSRTRVQSRRAGDLRDAGKTMSNQVNPNA